MNARTELLLHVLCVCVRALTMGQTARLLGFSDEANLRRFLRGLRAAGLVNVVTVWAKPVPEMREPLWSSEGVGEARAGDFQEVLRLARARWAGLPAVPQRCCIATKRAGSLFGVVRTGRLAEPGKATHDLGLAEVATTSALEKSCQLERWYGEDCAALRGSNFVPDAIIVSSEGIPRRVLELVGEHYDEPKLKRGHAFCGARQLAYELW